MQPTVQINQGEIMIGAQVVAVNTRDWATVVISDLSTWIRKIKSPAPQR